jgi:hypothetical protein
LPGGPVLAALDMVVAAAARLEGWVAFGPVFHSDFGGGDGAFECSVDLCVGIIEGNVTGSSIEGLDVGGIDGGDLEVGLVSMVQYGDDRTSTYSRYSQGMECQQEGWSKELHDCRVK